jgi:hypothetical protein
MKGRNEMSVNTQEMEIVHRGAVLEDANPAERSIVLSGFPAPVRVIWHVIGRPRYARHIRRVRG